MEIPNILVNEIRQGRVLLFLGSGASIGAKHPRNISPPVGNQLADMLCDKFLGGEYKNHSLAHVAELAISETDLFQVQSYIHEVFKDFSPSDFHKKIPTFRWASIITTNYDNIIEDAYSQSKDRLQDLVVFKKDNDRVEEKIKRQNQLMYIKLHGCIRDINDPSIPLILTPEQYITHKKNRTHLFNRLQQLALEYPLLFIGHSLGDSDIRNIFIELDDLKDARPRSYLLTPSIKEAEKRLWENRKVTTIDMTFENFLNKLESEISPETRRVISLIDNTEHLVLQKYKVKSNTIISSNLENFLEHDVIFVHGSMKVKQQDPKTFYKGYFNNFAPIIQELDVKRNLNDKILSEIILIEEEIRREIVEFYIVVGHAGSGKSVMLKRLAYEASTLFDKLCLFVKASSFPNYEAIYELYHNTRERIYLFIDPIRDYIETLQEILIKAKNDKLPLTIIAAERKNEWNINHVDLEMYLTEMYEIKYLSEKEIEILIGLLKKHNSLGHLKELPFEKQKEELSLKLGRQLLVALHEATMGKPFSDIIFDEYNSLSSLKSKSIYLTICILHRLGINVRAGLISRAHKISFKEFQENFFHPLEYIVFINQDEITKDYYYQTRHSHIAEMVFERVLTSPQDRFDEYLRIINSFDLGYKTDLDSFSSLMKGKSLDSLFPDPDMVRHLFKYAHEIKPNDPTLLQQEAIFEMSCRGGSDIRAENLLNLAFEIDPQNRALAHSKSVLDLTKSKKAKTSIERNKLREKSKNIARNLIAKNSATSHPYHTIISLELEELKETIENGEQPMIERKIKELEKILNSTIQKFPNEPFILDAEARFSSLIKDNPKAIDSLNKAFNTNKRSSYLATRLAKFYDSEGDYNNAIKVLKECVDANPSDKNANFELSLLLQKYYEHNTTDIKFHLRRSFTKGDSNYHAQFFYARILYILNEFEEANILFKTLSNLNIDSRIKKECRSPIKDSDLHKIFSGEIIFMESTYGFIQRDGLQDRIYFYSGHTNANWDKLYNGIRVSFSILFNYYGPIAQNIKII